MAIPPEVFKFQELSTNEITYGPLPNNEEIIVINCAICLNDIKTCTTCSICNYDFCSDTCKKISCNDCKKGCVKCVMLCQSCKISRCLDCDKIHKQLTCHICNTKLSSQYDTKIQEECIEHTGIKTIIDSSGQCSLCDICKKPTCYSCLDNCLCCTYKLCKTCYETHNKDKQKCNECKKELCCKSCINIIHDNKSKCLLCIHEKKTFDETNLCRNYTGLKITCKQINCTQNSTLYACCSDNHRPMNLFVINSLLYGLVPGMHMCTKCNQIFCREHIKRHPHKK
jgi:hypothetical protein